MEQAKLDFIHDELEEWAVWMDGRVRAEMNRLKIGDTQDLINSIAYQVFSASGLNDGEYKLSFLEYGRMVDIGAGRGYKNSIAENARAYKKATGSGHRRPKKWYSKTTYGGLNRLIYSIINGYQPAIINTLKESMT